MIPDDRATHPSIQAGRRRARDVAYGCFLYIGAMLGTAFVLNRIPTSWLLHQWVGAVLSLPVIMAGLVVAGLVGIAYSIRARQEHSLVLLAVMTLTAPLVLLGASGAGGISDGVRLIGAPFFVTYTLLALALPLRWFSRRRRSWSSG